MRDVLNENEIQDSREEFFTKFNISDEDSVTEYLNRSENQLSELGIIGTNNDIQSPTQLRWRSWLGNDDSWTVCTTDKTGGLIVVQIWKEIWGISL